MTPLGKVSFYPLLDLLVETWKDIWIKYKPFILLGWAIELVYFGWRLFRIVQERREWERFMREFEEF